jgi:hypothetical protein
MSQTSKYRELDAILFAKSLDAGLADAALYDGRTPCTVLIDRELQDYGPTPGSEFGAGPASEMIRRMVMRLQLCEIPEPRAGAVVRLVDTREEFTLRLEIGRDESRSSWEVVPRR